MDKNILTLAEIHDRYDSEWVLLEDPETTDMLEIVRGKVLYHSKDRDEVYRRMRELHPRHAAIWYTGKLPEDMAVIL